LHLLVRVRARLRLRLRLGLGLGLGLRVRVRPRGDCISCAVSSHQMEELFYGQRR